MNGFNTTTVHFRTYLIILSNQQHKSKKIYKLAIPIIKYLEVRGFSTLKTSRSVVIDF